MRVGIIASFISTVKAPPTCKRQTRGMHEEGKTGKRSFGKAPPMCAPQKYSKKNKKGDGDTQTYTKIISGDGLTLATGSNYHVPKSLPHVSQLDTCIQTYAHTHTHTHTHARTRTHARTKHVHSHIRICINTLISVSRTHFQIQYTDTNTSIRTCFQTTGRTSKMLSWESMGPDVGVCVCMCVCVCAKRGEGEGDKHHLQAPALPCTQRKQ